MSSLLRDYLNDNIEPVAPAGVVVAVYESNDDDDDDCTLDGSRSTITNEQQEIKNSDHEQKKFVKAELRSYFKGPEQIKTLEDVNGGIEESLVGSELVDSLGVPQVFGLYRFDAYHKNELPIDYYKEDILNTIDTNSVTVISGKTGCGKTTQVPQYILDQCRSKKIACNIVVTQPRRIAAINIAQRVCEERGWALGTVVGYQVGLDSNFSRDVVLTYMTTEILLQKLILHKNLNKFTHIVIDEIHERSKNLDLLLLVVRKYLFTNSPHVKVILMSATVDEEKFAHYFCTIARDKTYLLAPILKIEKKLEYTTDTYYYDSLKHITQTDVVFDINVPQIAYGQYAIAAKLVCIFDNMDKMDPVTNQKIIGSVLIFLPGINEIELMDKQLQKQKSSKCSWELHYLHSSLSTDNMTKAFLKPKAGTRKILLSTNVAESSLTLPDVDYVIDFCLTKVMITDEITKFCSLSLQWASHVHCIQRSGRVGRVANGRVYRLVPQEFYENEMPTDPVPEIQRAPLENIVLYLKMLELHGPPKNILALALSPPNLKDVENSIWHLKEAGALLRTCGGKEVANDGDLTFLGKIMGSLPLDIHASKLIVLGHLFSCLEDAIIMATGATVGNVFKSQFHARLLTYKTKLLWSDASHSDFIMLLNIYHVWQRACRDNTINSGREEMVWCRKNFLDIKALREWQILIREIKKRLKRYGIEEAVGPELVRISPTIKPLILKVMICGAFYPNYFLKANDYDANEAEKVLSGRDKFKTIYFTNMKPNQPGQIYVRKIKELLNTGENVQIGFDTLSSKIFVEFKSFQSPQPVTIDGVPVLVENSSKIPSDVYVAIRKRQLKIPNRLQILPENLAWEFANTAEALLQKRHKEKRTRNINYNPLPGLDVEYMEIVVSHIVDAGNLYCQLIKEDTFDLLDAISKALNDPGVVLKPARKLTVDDQIYAAKFNVDNKFYRCKIKNILDGTSADKKSALILFIDYGNSQVVPTNCVYDIPNNEECQQVPPIAICCMLSEIQPSLSRYHTGIWGNDANKFVKNKCEHVQLHAKVYSVVDDVVSAEIFLSSEKDPCSSINQLLIDHGFAEKCEENYLSKENRLLRKMVLQSENPKSEASQYNYSSNVTRYRDFEEPEFIEENVEIVELKGPFSVLEMKLRGVTSSSSSAKIHISEESVNTVLLDENPADEHARLIVAGSVTQSFGGRRLNIGQTTVMPNIRGFPLFMVLTFCPEMDPKLTPIGDQVASILCGLGATSKDRHTANFQSHDISLLLDIELDDETIYNVNMLRYTMNAGISMMESIAREEARLNKMYAIQSNMISKLKLLLTREPPKSVKPVYVKHATIWNQYDCSLDVNIMRYRSHDEERDIFKMLWFVKLDSSKQGQAKIQQNLNELLDIAKRLKPPRDIVCYLCNSDVLSTIVAVGVHLISNQHKKRVQKFEGDI